MQSAVVKVDAEVLYVAYSLCVKRCAIGTDYCEPEKLSHFQLSFFRPAALYGVDMLPSRSQVIRSGLCRPYDPRIAQRDVTGSEPV